MQNDGPPAIVRIKRKRTDEPLQALLFENAPTRKRVRKERPGFVFKLARTEEQLALSKDTGLVLNREEENRKGRTLFSIPSAKRKRGEISGDQKKGEIYGDQNDGDGQEVSPEILDMVSSYLRKEKTLEGNNYKRDLANERDTLNGDYVYDVYYRKPLDNKDLHDSGSIGYVKLSEEELEELDNNVDSDGSPNTDDEDSNSEDYYLNDYPEDEDGELDDDSYEGLACEGESEAEGEGEGEWEGDNEIGVASSGLGDRFPDQTSDTQGIGRKFTAEEDEQFAEDAEDENGTDFERHSFFPGDVEDPLAIHRDRIFDRLAKLIKEQEKQGK